MRKTQGRVQEAASMGQDFRVGPTCWTAFARGASELIRDEWALKLAGEEGARLNARFMDDLGARFMKDVVALRTVYLDNVIQDFVQAGGKQVVILGAGMDSRAWRLQRLARASRGFTLFEVDEPVLLDMKRERLGPSVIAQPLCRRVEIPAALTCTEEWGGALVDHPNFDSSVRSLFLIEDVSMYMPEQDFRAALAKVSALSARDSIICGDWVPRITVQGKLPGATSDIIAVFGSECNSPWLYGPRNARAFSNLLKEAGFATAEQLTSRAIEREVREFLPFGMAQQKIHLSIKSRSWTSYAAWAMCTFAPARLCAGAPSDIGLRVYMATRE
ncbi:Leucine carboxyl methyltransferase 1 [Hondaea fermentalgiana]|uniref:Leucine carboxyl methyltransferase 1 n=1 Tax=Hondaea fermentalgiana TaxID=2315210 RepID=A0A2R5GU09_9STRA|nr:Leucine carboxyl methyltransferase 1 [Hondaea fermentalgiana]|eukprot:GBG34352.1 Leucine carboxyl methyltransferase 1 [Hondaea fermentalgiana]